MTNDNDNLPDSSFLWIASGGVRDAEGKTLPRSLRHLSYRDMSGKIIKEQLDKVDINMAGLPADVKSKVVMLQSGTVSARLYPDKMSSIAITEKDGKKVAIITGELMNIKPNANNWGIEKQDATIIARDFKDISIRTLHAESEFSVIGTGDSAVASEDGAISYKLTIYNPEAVTKLENKEWNERNMGISPQVSWSNVKCSVCGRDLLTAIDDKTKNIGVSSSGMMTHLGCGHEFGKTYDGVFAYRIVMTPGLMEATMTTRPAYKIAGSGNISNIDVMAASINDLCSLQALKKLEKINTVRGEKGMEDVQTMLGEKNAEIETLKAELTTMKTKSDEALVAETKLAKETLEAEKTKVTDALKAVNDSKKEVTDLKATAEKATKDAEEKDVFIAKVVKQTRETELAKIISDKELVAKILSVEMTEEQFKAKVEEITAIKKLSGGDGEVGGSTIPEGQTSSADYEKFFGMSQADHEKELFGSVDVAEMNK